MTPPGGPIRAMGLTIAGSPLEPVIAAFEREIRACGLLRLHPSFYLSTEWGVPFPSVSIGIPFYLASAELTALHLEKTGLVEGTDPEDVLRYLRHELGHVVNYAYRLHDDPGWVAVFGPMSAPYEDEYAPRPFSRHHVQHLPGWYAQKHPDEDWAETFAVWMTPGSAWRDDYAASPDALAKLECCEATIRRIGDLEPELTDVDPDEDVSGIEETLEELYADDEDAGDPEAEGLPAGIDRSLRAIFTGGERPAGALFARLEQPLVVGIHRWTGLQPERARLIVRRLALRSRALTYALAAEEMVSLELTMLVTTLATAHLQDRRR